VTHTTDTTTNCGKVTTTHTEGLVTYTTITDPATGYRRKSWLEGTIEGFEEQFTDATGKFTETLFTPTDSTTRLSINDPTTGKSTITWTKDGILQRSEIIDNAAGTKVSTNHLTGEIVNEGFTPTTPTTPTYPTQTPAFASGQEMIDAICNADKHKFCGGGDVFELQAVCNSIHDLPDAARFYTGTSLRGICMSDFDKDRVCTDAALKTKVCTDGKTLNRDLCAMYPDKCSASASSCAKNLYDCLATPQTDYNFYCNEFPELCFQNYTSATEMIADICAVEGACTTNAAGEMLPDLTALCPAVSGTPSFGTTNY
jgi:hypothetical protein